jgi:hypothetical protein
MVVRPFVAKRSIYDDEVRLCSNWQNPAGRRQTGQKPPAGGKQFLGDQNCEGRPHGPADDAVAQTFMLECK